MIVCGHMSTQRDLIVLDEATGERRGGASISCRLPTRVAMFAPLYYPMEFLVALHRRDSGTNSTSSDTTPPSSVPSLSTQFSWVP